MAEETPKEKYERLQRAVQSELLTAYPNPERKGCLGDAAVKRLAETKELKKDEVWDHVTHCSPCYAEYLAHRERFREGERRRRNRFRIQVVAAACALIVAVGALILLNRRPDDRVFEAEFDLRHRLTLRGGDDLDSQPTELNPPLTLRRGHLHLKIDLPTTWSPGKYDVAFSERPGDRQVFETTSEALLQGTSSVLRIDARLDVKPGDYSISLRREGSAWRGYPVRVTEP